MKIKFAPVAFAAIIVLFFINSAFSYSRTDLVGSSGGAFGFAVTVLPNGNYVITDNGYDAGSTLNVGAVYLYDGNTMSVISTMTGTSASDAVGTRVFTLPNGNFVVASTAWRNASNAAVGALTYCSATTGCPSTVTPANSLVGANAGDLIGNNGIAILTNGNFVVKSNSFGGGLGAATWCNGSTGCTGVVSAANSVVGSTASDLLATVTPLTNGNYIVSSNGWDNGSIANAGVAALCDGTVGRTGTLSSANAIVGTHANDQVGTYITALQNGNYVVQSPFWNTDAGAVTFGNGTTGVVGEVSASTSLLNVSGYNIYELPNGNFLVSGIYTDGVSPSLGAVTLVDGNVGLTGYQTPANSLVGSTAGDWLSGITVLKNGNYVVSSPSWHDPATGIEVGAVHWCSGSGGCTGTISVADSFTGAAAQDFYGMEILALTNGNYVIGTQGSDYAATDSGALTWANGAVPITGKVDASRSLVGTSNGDNVGNVAVLSNGNFVAYSSLWHNPNGSLGAVTWCRGDQPCAGAVSTSNSLTGSGTDQIGVDITPLTNGSYVVSSGFSIDLTTTNVGAVTWRDGTQPTTGIVTTANSMYGASANDDFGSTMKALANGNYVVTSQNYHNASGVVVGAFTWGNGNGGSVGMATASNSLIGVVGGVTSGLTSTELPNGNLLILARNFTNGSITRAGLATLIAGNGPTTGVMSDANTVFGTVTSQGTQMSAAYDSTRGVLLVGRNRSNLVTILKPTISASHSGNWSDSSVWNFSNNTVPHDFYIPNGVTVNLDSVVSPNSVRVDCGGNITGASASAYIIGNIQKDYCAPEAFSYPVGTANGYSPVDANITALGSSPSSLTINSTQVVHPTLAPTVSLKRYWTLTESGDLTTDLTFHYLDGDISTNEATYKLYRVEAGVPSVVSPYTLNTSANTISTTGISSFSDWTAGNISPTASDVTVAGRVMQSNGVGVKGTRITAADAQGNLFSAITNAFGYYSFDSFRAGETYVLTAQSKQFTFQTPVKVISPTDNLADQDFVAVDPSAFKKLPLAKATPTVTIGKQARK